MPTSTKLITRSFRAFCTGLVIASCLTGCGGSGGVSAPAPDSSATTPTAPEPVKKTHLNESTTPTTDTP